MLGKLAVRNVKRSAKDYIIYFITLTISFSLIFALNLISCSDAVTELSKGLGTFQYLMYFINVLVLFVICYLIHYTTGFMFQKRSKEFGMYSLLGIPAKKIHAMFLLESIMFGLLALAAAVPAGFVVSQFLSLVIVNLLELPQAVFIAFGIKPLALLGVYFSVIYALVLLGMKKRMKNASVYDLLYYEKQNEKKLTKTKKHRNIMFIVSLIMLTGALLAWNVRCRSDNADSASIMSDILLCFTVIIISLYGLMMSVGEFMLSVVLNNKKIKYSGDNLFIARTFSSKVRTMGVTLGTLSVLITFTLFFLNMAGLNKGLYDYQIERKAPFDVSVTDKRERLGEYMEVVEEQYSVKEEFVYDVYKDKSASVLKTQAYYSYRSEEKRFDPVIRLSDYNRQLEMKNEKPVTLQEDEYLLVSEPAGIESAENNAALKMITLCNGISLRQKTITAKGYWLGLSHESYALIVPDNAVKNLELSESFLLVDTNEETTAQLEAVIEERMAKYLLYVNEDGTAGDYLWKVRVRGTVIEEQNTMMVMIVTVCLYMAFIFIASAGAILATQCLSDSARYQYRYTLLSRLGVKENLLYKTIKKQLLILFGMPVIFPVMIVFCLMASVNMAYQFMLSGKYSYVTYFMGALGCFLIFYAVYFLAAYFGFKRTIRE